VVGKTIAVTKYAARLSAEERAQLDELIRKGRAGWFPDGEQGPKSSK
jgi:hypothetical protein